MRIEVLDDTGSVALAAAATIAAEARAYVAARGRFALAVSGGHTPWIMLRALAGENVPWVGVHVFQVDERVAPVGHPDRNLTHPRESLLQHAPLRPKQIHAMPVEEFVLEEAATHYVKAAQGDRRVAASARSRPPRPRADGHTASLVPGDAVLDVTDKAASARSRPPRPRADGHTASLVPGDAVLDVTDKDVALSGVYAGRRRMTLTYPMLNRAWRVLWVVTGNEKVEMLRRLCDSDASIPAGRVRREQALLLADRAAAGNLAA